MRCIAFRSLTLVVAFAVSASAEGNNLLENGSFEQPEVSTRTAVNTDAHPELLPEAGFWERMLSEETDEGGKATIGLTQEIARTGKQSLYVNYRKVTATQREALLTTKPIPVQGGRNYRASMWGRIDRDRPLALDERRLEMWVEAHFLAPDGKTQVGEPINGLNFIPGIAIPAGTRVLTLLCNKWKESSAEFSVPEGASFVRLYWLWNSGPDEGETDGIVFWDDASLVEVKDEPSEIAKSPVDSTEKKQAPVVAPDEDFKQQ